jgi:hypothetical protein
VEDAFVGLEHGESSEDVDGLEFLGVLSFCINELRGDILSGQFCNDTAALFVGVARVSVVKFLQQSEPG